MTSLSCTPLSSWFIKKHKKIELLKCTRVVSKMFRRFGSIVLKLRAERMSQSEVIPAWMFELYVDVKWLNWVQLLGFAFWHFFCCPFKFFFLKRKIFLENSINIPFVIFKVVFFLFSSFSYCACSLWNQRGKHEERDLKFRLKFNIFKYFKKISFSWAIFLICWWSSLNLIRKWERKVCWCLYISNIELR